MANLRQNAMEQEKCQGHVLMMLCGEDLFRREGAEDFEEVIMRGGLGGCYFHFTCDPASILPLT